MRSFTESQEVYWVVMGKINAGQEAAFKELVEKLNQSTEEEPGALNYEWSSGDGGTTFHVFERYADSAAAQLHLQRSGELVGKLHSVVNAVTFTLYGSPDDTVREMLTAAHPTVMKPLAGFGR